MAATNHLTAQAGGGHEVNTKADPCAPFVATVADRRQHHIPYSYIAAMLSSPEYF